MGKKFRPEPKEVTLTELCKELCFGVEKCMFNQYLALIENTLIYVDQEIIAGFKTKENKKFLFSMYYETVRSHMHSMTILFDVDKNLNSSVTALMRPLYETVYKAIYTFSFGENKLDELLENYEKSKKSFPAMWKIVRTVDKLKENDFDNWKKETWSNLNDFSHSGNKQLFQHFNKNNWTIGDDNLTLTTKVGLLNFSLEYYFKLIEFILEKFEITQQVPELEDNIQKLIECSKFFSDKGKTN